MTKSLFLSRWLLSPLFVFGFASAGRAADVKIENLSNDPVYVAQADNQGLYVSHGWVAIKPNNSQTFTAPDTADLYIRVQDKDGKAITFTNHKTFLNFPAHADKFSVAAVPDDANVWVLKHGDNLENSKNIQKGDSLPFGWSSRAFFEIGTGSHKLEIKP